MSVYPTNINNVPLLQLCRMVLLATWLSALAYFVLHIVGGRAKKKVGRIYAHRIIAVMKSVKAGWNWTISKLISDSVRQDMAAFSIDRYSKPAISGLVAPGHPRPTPVFTRRPINFFKKTFFKCDMISSSHDRSSKRLRSEPPRVNQHLGGLPYYTRKACVKLASSPSS